MDLFSGAFCCTRFWSRSISLAFLSALNNHSCALLDALIRNNLLFSRLCFLHCAVCSTVRYIALLFLFFNLAQPFSLVFRTILVPSLSTYTLHLSKRTVHLLCTIRLQASLCSIEYLPYVMLSYTVETKSSQKHTIHSTESDLDIELLCKDLVKRNALSIVRNASETYCSCESGMGAADTKLDSHPHPANLFPNLYRY